MKNFFKLLIPIGVAALTGCVVVPCGYHRGYYEPHVRIIAPAPVVVVRPYY